MTQQQLGTNRNSSLKHNHHRITLIAAAISRLPAQVRVVTSTPNPVLHVKSHLPAPYLTQADVQLESHSADPANVHNIIINTAVNFLLFTILLKQTCDPRKSRRSNPSTDEVALASASLIILSIDQVY